MQTLLMRPHRSLGRRARPVVSSVQMLVKLTKKAVVAGDKKDPVIELLDRVLVKTRKGGE